MSTLLGGVYIVFITVNLVLAEAGTVENKSSQYHRQFKMIDHKLISTFSCTARTWSCHHRLITNFLICLYDKGVPPPRAVLWEVRSFFCLLSFDFAISSRIGANVWETCFSTWRLKACRCLCLQYRGKISEPYPQDCLQTRWAQAMYPTDLCSLRPSKISSAQLWTERFHFVQNYPSFFFPPETLKRKIEKNLCKIARLIPPYCIFHSYWFRKKHWVSFNLCHFLFKNMLFNSTFFVCKKISITLLFLWFKVFCHPYRNENH